MGLTYPGGDRTILTELLLQEILLSSLYSFLPCSTFLCNIISKTNNLHSFLPISQSCHRSFKSQLKSIPQTEIVRSMSDKKKDKEEEKKWEGEEEEKEEETYGIM